MSDVYERRVVDYDVDVDALAAAAAEVMVDDGVDPWTRYRLRTLYDPFRRDDKSMKVWVTKYLPAVEPLPQWVDGEWRTGDAESEKALSLTPDGSWDEYNPAVVVEDGRWPDSPPPLVDLPWPLVTLLRQDPLARRAFFDAVTGDGPCEWGAEQTVVWFADGVDEHKRVRSGEAVAVPVELTGMPMPQRRPWWRRVLGV